MLKRKIDKEEYQQHIRMHMKREENSEGWLKEKEAVLVMGCN
jgi:hypothetical protein